MLTHGVGFVRDLFPRAKFIFHWRWNYTRIASSDFWSAERSANETSAHFAAIVVHVQRLEFLYLAHTGNRRAASTYGEGARGPEWLIP